MFFDPTFFINKNDQISPNALREQSWVMLTKVEYLTKEMQKDTLQFKIDLRKGFGKMRRNRRILAFSFFCFAFVTSPSSPVGAQEIGSAASNSILSQDNCSPVDLRPKLPPIRNQDSLGWCHGFIAADLASLKLGKAISAVDATITANHTLLRESFDDICRSRDRGQLGRTLP